MKSVLSLIAAILLSATSLLAQPKKAILEFQNAIYDFGNIKEEDGAASCEFTFKNAGNAPLVITRAAASCGCTQPEYPKEPIAPGKTGVIKVTYNAQGRPGTFIKNIYIYSNSDPEKQTISIKGNVIPAPTLKEKEYPYVIGDLRLKSINQSFSEIKDNETKTETVNVINFGKMPLTVSFDRLPAHITAKLVPASLRPGENGLIVLTYNAALAKDWGIKKDEFYITTPQNSAISADRRFTVSADIREDFSKLTIAERNKRPIFSISPNVVDFGTINKDTNLKRNITISNTGKSVLIIRKINNESNFINAGIDRLSIKPGKAANLTISLNPDKASGPIVNNRLYIISNDPVNPTSDIKILGKIQ